MTSPEDEPAARSSTDGASGGFEAKDGRRGAILLLRIALLSLLAVAAGLLGWAVYTLLANAEVALARAHAAFQRRSPCRTSRHAQRRRTPP